LGFLSPQKVLLEKIAPFVKFPLNGKEETRIGGGIMKKRLKNVSRNPHSLNDSEFK